MTGFWSQLEPGLGAATTLSHAAQLFADAFYRDARASAALVRVFVTLPFAWLPPDERAFAQTFVAHAGDGAHVDDATPVLALLGSRGIEPAWNDRALSREHRAIPLLSEAFVAEAPMIARLLRETGFALPGTPKANRQYVRNVEDVGNLFFVGDAATATDERGRRIIPASAFVERYGVRTVYGSGAAYDDAPHGSQTFVTGIVFSRKLLLREDVASFAMLMREFSHRSRALADRSSMF